MHDYKSVCIYLGSHIRVCHAVYCHHMLVVKVIDDETLHVIHYTGSVEPSVDKAVEVVATSFFGSSDTGVVKEGDVPIDLEEYKVELVEYDDPGVVLYKGQDAIERARTRVGEKDYHLLTKNCESFVNWTITGIEETSQGETAIVAGAAAGVGVLVALTWAGWKWLRKDDDKSKDEESNEKDKKE